MRTLLVLVLVSCSSSSSSLKVDSGSSDAATDASAGSCGTRSAGDDGPVVADTPPPANPQCPQSSVDHSPPATTHYVYPLRPVVPFYQWENNIGYCGEVTVIQ